MSKTRFSKWSYRVAVGSRVFGGWDKYKGKQVKRRRNHVWQPGWVENCPSQVKLFL